MARALDFSVNVEVVEKGKRMASKNDWQLKSDIDGQWTLEDLFLFTKGALISISKEVLAEEQSKGFDSRPTTIVDGRFNRKIEDVHPLGRIQFVARQSIKKIILETFDAIRFRTKIVTGEYGRHNVVTFNGQQIANNRSTLEKWLDSKETFEQRDVFHFVNTAPYARKLESLGISSTTSGSSRRKAKYERKDKKRKSLFMNTVAVPNGTYALAYKYIASKYKNNSFIRYRTINGSEITIKGDDINEKTGKPFRRTFAKGKSKGRPYMYPSILISVASAGILEPGK